MMTESWSSSAHRATAQFEAWRHALNNSHLEWRLDAPADPAFGARIRQRTLDGVRIIECRCDPVPAGDGARSCAGPKAHGSASCSNSAGGR